MVNITKKMRRIRHKTSINAQGSPTYTLHKRRNAISKLTINTLLFLQNDVGQDLKIGSPSPWLHKSITSILMDMSQLQRYWALTNLDKKENKFGGNCAFSFRARQSGGPWSRMARHGNAQWRASWC